MNISAYSYDANKQLAEQCPQLIDSIKPFFNLLYDENGYSRPHPNEKMRFIMDKLVESIRNQNLVKFSAYFATCSIFSRKNISKSNGSWEIIHPYTIPFLARLWPGRHRTLNFSETFFLLEYGLNQKQVPEQAIGVAMLVMFSVFKEQVNDITEKEYDALAVMNSWNVFNHARNLFH